MAFQVSPGVLVTEKDLTTVIPAISVSIGGLAGFFKWGPVDDVALVSTENNLVQRFGKPDPKSASTFFTAANFLSYGIRLKLVRVVGGNAKNAKAAGAAALVKNDSDYATQVGSSTLANRIMIAKYPGDLGNSLRVAMCTSAVAYKKTLSTTVVGSRGSDQLTAGHDVETEVAVGSTVRDPITGQQRVVIAVSLGVMTLDRKLDKDINLSADVLVVKWEFADLVGVSPGTSSHAASLGGLNDEIHIVVVDTTGKISGAPGTILERYAGLSKGGDAKREDNSSNYYATVLNNSSQYIRFASHVGSADWGTEVLNKNFSNTSVDSASHNYTLTGGVDHNAEGNDASLDDNIMDGYDLFKDADSVDVSFMLTGEVSAVVSQYVVNNICEARKDCVAFISPPKDSVVSNKNNEVEDIKAFRDALQLNTSYAFLDSGWKYQYDRYNDMFRWVPLNGDIAGLCARTDDTNDPWWSPAGYNRGVIKNVVKLAWSPSKFERDELYVNGINPVITTPGQGTVLFGDKTLLAKPSAFDRLNVRRLFIILEKSIAQAARFTLFEFNDSFTREQFKNLVEPFLRSVKARRGIYDFRVVCDETNNTADVIDANNFIGDIYIKPARSINTIQLNFVSVRTGVEFSEIVGKVG